VSKYFIDSVPHQFMILMFRYRGGVWCCSGSMSCWWYSEQGRKQDLVWTHKAFKGIIGEGIILNTSFNLAGEPLRRNVNRRNKKLRPRWLQSNIHTKMANTKVLMFLK